MMEHFCQIEDAFIDRIDSDDLTALDFDDGGDAWFTVDEVKAIIMGSKLKFFADADDNSASDTCSSSGSSGGDEKIRKDTKGKKGYNHKTNIIKSDKVAKNKLLGKGNRMKGLCNAYGIDIPSCHYVEEEATKAETIQQSASFWDTYDDLEANIVGAMFAQKEQGKQANKSKKSTTTSSSSSSNGKSSPPPYYYCEEEKNELPQCRVSGQKPCAEMSYAEAVESIFSEIRCGTYLILPKGNPDQMPEQAESYDGDAESTAYHNAGMTASHGLPPRRSKRAGKRDHVAKQLIRDNMKFQTNLVAQINQNMSCAEDDVDVPFDESKKSPAVEFPFDESKQQEESIYISPDKNVRFAEKIESVCMYEDVPCTSSNSTETADTYAGETIEVSFDGSEEIEVNLPATFELQGTEEIVTNDSSSFDENGGDDEDDILSHQLFSDFDTNSCASDSSEDEAGFLSLKGIGHMYLYDVPVILKPSADASSSEAARSLFHRAMDSWNSTEYEDATKDLLVCLQIRESIFGKSNAGVAQAYLWLGKSYWYLMKFEQAQDAFRRCYRIQKRLGKTWTGSNTSSTHNVTYWIGKYMKVTRIEDKEKYISNLVDSAKCEKQGDIALLHGDFDTAMEKYENSVEHEHLNQKDGQQHSEVDLADLYFKISFIHCHKGQLPLALDGYRSALAVYLSVEGVTYQRYVLDTCREILRVCQKMGWSTPTTQIYIESLPESILWEKSGDASATRGERDEAQLAYQKAIFAEEESNIGKMQLALAGLHIKVADLLLIESTHAAHLALGHYCTARTIYDNCFGQDDETTISTTRKIRSLCLDMAK